VAITGWTKIVSTPIAKKISFPNPVLKFQSFQEMFSYFILRVLAFVIGSCDPVSNLTAKNIVGWVGQPVCM